MTGENFKRLSRCDEKLDRMKLGLQDLRTEWGDEYYHQNEDGEYDFDFYKLRKIEQKIEHLKHCMYVYVHNRYGWEYASEFDRNVLW